MLFKLVYSKEVHLYSGEIGYSKLKNFCSKIFKFLPIQYDFVYIDDENDEIFMTSDIDNDNFNALMLQNGKSIVKINIRQRQFINLCSNSQQENIQGAYKEGNENKDYENIFHDSSFQFEPLTSQSDISQVSQLQEEQSLKGQIEYVSFEESTSTVNKQLQFGTMKEQNLERNSFVKQSINQSQIKEQGIKTIVNDFLTSLNNKVIENYISQRIQQQNTFSLQSLSLSVPYKQLQSQSSVQQDQQERIQQFTEKQFLSDRTQQSELSTEEYSYCYEKKIDREAIIDKKINELLPKLMVTIEKQVEKKVNEKIQRLLFCNL